MFRMHWIDVIDSHTGGEPTRVVLAGFPYLGSGSLVERSARLRDRHDRWRSAIVCEPRGSDTMVGALLLPASDPAACAGVIFFNNVGTLGMCGHGTIGLVRTMAHLGRIGPGRHRIETPVGTVEAELHSDGKVSIDNVVSYRHAKDVELDVSGIGRVRGDVAWGGNWFFISHDSPTPLEPAHWRRLTSEACAVREALDAAGVRGADGAEIDHIEFSAPSPTAGVDSRNFVLCPGLAYDRSPCGTGTSAKLACLADDGLLEPGQTWRQESLLGSVFEASYRDAPGGILPRIAGYAHILADARLSIDPDDPFAWGVGT